MKIFCLLTILFNSVLTTIYIHNADINKTILLIEDAESRFGPPFRDGENGILFESKPKLACGDSINRPFDFDNQTEIKLVALIERGNCSFVKKVAVAQASGYTGVIIYNNIKGAPFAMGTDNDDDITIPSRMVSLNDGLKMLKYTYTPNRQNFALIFYSNNDINPQIYIIAFLGFVSLGFFIIGIGFGIKLCYDAIKRRANRLRKCHLKKIPIKKLVKGEDPYETCAICLEDFKNGEKLRILPCNHAYHCTCIDPWLLRQKRNCPICKYRIKIPGRDEDTDSVDGTPPQSRHNVINEQTPLINSRNANLTSYVGISETDVQIIPENSNPVSKNCYENLSFGTGESQPGTSNAISNSETKNTATIEAADRERLTDLTKIV